MMRDLEDLSLEEDWSLEENWSMLKVRLNLLLQEEILKSINNGC